ncbi:predicted protein [Nematostella vectensis]|uniref:Uncharacterized protein n=1 Tax=Nematostella vectensis TaxID=45351 RepID=A7SC23_NEMVE|nr:predicted protein [Nematostella vectensis]|eukprot:XP_001630795.1 predicted protein [Nematostella vectensis]
MTSRRDFVVETKTGNYRIRRGQRLLGNCHLAQRDPEVFETPGAKCVDTFDPDRFSLNETLKPNLLCTHGRMNQKPSGMDHNCAGAFNFNSLILEWWKRQGPARYDQLECLTLTQATGASFTMTNHSALNHCFDCHPLWCACWPVYCVTAIPYKVWRNWVNDVSDVIIKMEGEISVARPNAIGYDLGDLHRAAAVQKTEPQEVQQR